MYTVEEIIQDWKLSDNLARAVRNLFNGFYSIAIGDLLDEITENCYYSVDKNEFGDKVNHPSHYTFGKIEPIDVIYDWGFDYCLGCALKYIARCEHKENKRQDLEKAVKYVEFELKYGDGSNNCITTVVDNELS